MSFVDHLKGQIKYLQNDDYSYDELDVFVEGDSQPFEFDYEQEFEIDVKGNCLVVSDEDEEAPETIIKLDKIIASELVES